MSIIRPPSGPHPSVQHLRSATPLLKLIAILGTALGALLLAGGIYLAVSPARLADTKFTLLGNTFSSTSVGVAMAFIGAVLVITSFRLVVRAIERLVALPKD